MEDEGAQLNPFGEALQRLMRDSNVGSPEELSEILRQHGYEVDALTIRMWMEADPRFLWAIEEGW
jgi:hypothetical protein